MRIKSPVWLMGFILAVGFLVRLYRIGEPLGDWHSWRQADTAAVTREYVKNGIDLLYPRYMDLSSIPSGKDNPEGWRMVEFPLVNGMTAKIIEGLGGLEGIEGQDGLVKISRLISIIFSLGSIIFLYLVVGKFSGEKVGLLAAGVMAILPYNIFYSRVILPEVPLVFFSLAAIYFFAGNFFWLSAGSAAIALLLKPYAIFLALPILYLGWKQCRAESFALGKFVGGNLLVRRHPLVPTSVGTRGKPLAALGVASDGSSLTRKFANFACFSSAKLIKLFVWMAVALTPFLLWRVWIMQFPEGIPAFTWLLNGNGIRFKGAFFRWIFADRLGRLILGYWGLIPFGLGLAIKPTQKEGWFYHWWLLGILGYLVIFATGNVQHDYYQIMAVPIVSIFVVRGLAYLLRPGKDFSNLISYFLFLISVGFALAFGWYHIRDYFNINHPEIVEAGLAADKVLPAAAKVVAPYDGDTAFLFQTNRKGWPIGGAIDDKVSKGATHYVSVRFDGETLGLMEKCQVVLKTDKYVIIDLKPCID